MNISCDVIKDILPLYAEDMASQATRDLVDAHLCGCDQCAAILAKHLKQPELVPETDADALRRVKKALQKRRLWTAATAVMAAVTLFFWLFSFMTLLIPATCEEIVQSVQLLEDGSLRIVCQPTAKLGGSAMMQSDANVALISYTSRLDRLFPQESPQNSGGIIELYGSYAGDDAQHDRVNYWYLDPDGKTFGTLLYDAGREVPEKLPWSTNENLLGFFTIATTVAALLGGLAALLKAHRRIAVPVAALAAAAGCYAISTLLLTLGDMMIQHNSGVVSMYLIHIAILAVLLFVSGACALRLRNLICAE